MIIWAYIHAYSKTSVSSIFLNLSLFTLILHYKPYMGNFSLPMNKSNKYRRMMFKIFNNSNDTGRILLKALNNHSPGINILHILLCRCIPARYQSWKHKLIRKNGKQKFKMCPMFCKIVFGFQKNHIWFSQYTIK